MSEEVTVTTDTAAATGTQDATAATTDTQDATLLASADASKDEIKTGDDPALSADASKDEIKVPEEYADFTLPEGYTLDAELGGEFKTIAKELKLTQEQAQKLADLGAKQSIKFHTTQTEVLAKARETWANEAKVDKEYGGESFGENLSAAKSALDTFGNDALKTMLNQTGLGNHPEVIRFFVKAGKAISQDKLVSGDRAPRGADAPAQRVLYANTTK